MYLLDTNILSPLLTLAPPPQLLARMSDLGKRQLITSSINRAELIYGLLKGKKGQTFFLRMHHLFDRVQVLSFDWHSADTYARLKAELETKGLPLPALDLMIASVALSNELVLVTANERHFARIPELKVENWLRAP